MAAPTLALVLVALLGADSDLTRLGIREAMASGRVAFLGRVVATTELAGTGDETLAEAELELVACYFGIDCNARPELRLRYLVQSPDETSRPIELAVTGEVLVVLRAPPDDPARIAFDSDPRDGLDAAYRSAALARGTPRDGVELRSVYGGAAVRLRYAEIEAWAEARRQALAAADSPAAGSADGAELERWIGGSLAAAPDEAALVASLGAGCVRQTASADGERSRILHCYHDKSSRLWVEARVDDSGARLGRVSGFVVSREPLCDKRCALAGRFETRERFGIALGDAADRVTAILGEPLRRAETRLGSTRVTAMSFAPDLADAARIEIYYLSKGAVVGWSCERSD